LKKCSLQNRCQKTKSSIRFQELEEISKSLHEKIFSLEAQKKSEEKTSTLFLPQETQNLRGEFEQEVEKFKDHPKLYELLWKYSEVFGPLPKISESSPLPVLMDIELKPEWEGRPLRQKCWPMPLNDQEEINLQCEELLKAGLIESFPMGQIPQVCSPTFLVDKKGSTTRRMVIHYGKLNSRTKAHAAYLPSMETLIESLAKCRFKSTLDMRSGYWQVPITQRAANLSTFCVPSGRCFRPKRMMFGLMNAPGIFQELMETLTSQCKSDARVREILKDGHLASFFDDTGVGANSEEDHLYLLEKWFQVCKANQVRIKLSKCSFLNEKIDYLGFSLGWGTWQANKKNVEPILKFEVHNQKELRQILGAMNFYRRHVKGFTFDSAPLTDLLKKNVKWKWTSKEQNCLEKLKQKLASFEVLGTPKPNGEILMVTDSSNVGGGAALFQWQSLCLEQLPEKVKNGLTGVTGVKVEGNLKHNYPPEVRLVPLGHYNWKWSESRQKYHSWEQEILSGVLTLASQSRILQHLSIVWMTDNEAATSFLKGEPPLNKRMRRMYVFLNQFKLNIIHVAGCKNELCDFLSRGDFENKFQIDIEEEAKNAFQKMDIQLDLFLQ
jgi:hypothetical protein